jgi:hypothetical protein
MPAEVNREMGETMSSTQTPVTTICWIARRERAGSDHAGIISLSADAGSSGGWQDPGLPCHPGFDIKSKQRTGSRKAQWCEGRPTGNRAAVRGIEFNLPQIGDMPPEPPTLGGRVGAVLVSVVRRALFWYTAQLRFMPLPRRGASWRRLFRILNAQRQRQRTLMAEVRERLLNWIARLRKSCWHEKPSRWRRGWVPPVQEISRI